MSLYALFRNPLVECVAAALWLWMLVDALRRQEWFWAVWMFFFPGITTVIYFFLVFRASPLGTEGFELPGAASRRRIKELEDLIHNLDKPHHYLELGDIYFRKGNLAKAEENYRASLERDPKDIDARSHFGQCLLREKRPQEALPILREVCAQDPKHDYGYSLMAYAETLAAMGETDNAIEIWKQVLQSHNYARARTQLGELYLAKQRRDLADAEFREVINDDRHAPAFQRKRDRIWVRKAKSLIGRS